MSSCLSPTGTRPASSVLRPAFLRSLRVPNFSGKDRSSTAVADSGCFRRYAELNARATSYVKGNQELHLTLEKDEKDKIFLHTTAFARSAKMRDAALALYVNAKVGLEHCLDTHHCSSDAIRLVIGALLLPTRQCKTVLQTSAVCLQSW